MNRRSFFKFLGIGAATAAVAPKMLAQPSYSDMMEQIVLTIDRELRKDQLQTILPNDVQVGPEFWEHLKAIQKQRQLGVDDIKALQKVKNNANRR